MLGKLKLFLQSKVRSRRSGLVVGRITDLEKKLDLNFLEDEFVRVNQEVWEKITSPEYLWKKEQVHMHFKICPDITYCAIKDGRVIVTLSNIFTTEDEVRKQKTWLETTGEGFLTTHNPKGDVAFGVDLSATKDAPRGLADKVVLAGIFITVLGGGLRYVYLGARIPGYHRYKDMGVRKYVFGTRSNGKPLDPELYFYAKNGFEIMEIIPEYMHDPDSLNYGVLIRWKNPLFGITRLFPFLCPVIRFAGKKIFLRL